MVTYFQYFLVHLGIIKISRTMKIVRVMGRHIELERLKA